MSYFSVSKPKEVKLNIERSEFISNCLCVKTESDAKDFIKNISSRYNNATHNCWAYKVNENGVIKFNFSDNGEPSGTAGKPIFSVIEKNKLENIAIVVTRYFGGVKLGVRGLIDAYSESAEKGITESVIAEYKKSYIYEVVFDYSSFAEIERLLKRLEGWEIINKEFYDNVKIEISILEDHLESVLKIVETKSLSNKHVDTTEMPV